MRLDKKTFTFEKNMRVKNLIKVYFVRDGKNFYSISPLFALLSNMAGVFPEIITYASLDDVNAPDNASDHTVFAFSFNTIGFLQKKKAVEKFLQKHNREKTIFLAGGPHPSAMPHDLLNLGFDAVIAGSGENAFLDFIREVQAGGNPRGVMRKDVDNLDLFPPFPEKQYYYKPIEITRGCPHGCLFCQTSYLFSKKPVHRSVENILCYVKKAFGQRIKDFRFISPNALGYGSANGKPNPESIKKLLNGIRDIIGTKGRLFFGTFPSEIRPEFAGKELLKFLKSVVDNKRVIIGVQTGSERMLKACHRDHTLKDVEYAIENSLSAGFKVDIDLIFGMPGEKEADFNETVYFINKYTPSDVNFHLHYFIPLPGTPWQNKKPAPMPAELKKELERLVGKGRAWGAWLRQNEYTNF